MALFQGPSFYSIIYLHIVKNGRDMFQEDKTPCIFLHSFFFVFLLSTGHAQVLDHKKLGNQYYHEDAQWFLDNTPFFECSDKQIEQVYYYRWKLYKAHIRNVGPDQYVITEFINDVTWDRDPYSTINAAAMHHIYEGRWLKDDRYMNSYINYMFQQGGNNRSYSESISDAAYARYLVNMDSVFIVKQLDSMSYIYDQWRDHFDSSKHLYYIPAMPDATEYTIASIDASGGKDGFDDGEAFRPTINSYMYGNAKAIARIAALKGDLATSKLFMQRAADLKVNVQQSLWNDSLQHFADRYKVDNQYVHYWNFIRGRELAGMIPWYFNLPDDNNKYTAAWKHVLNTNQLLGKYGLRTNEPSYQYYFKQFVFYMGQRGSQWNGPSWPYQTSQLLAGMANLLNNYNQHIVTTTDYIKSLRLFTRQHYLPNDKTDLVENYDPNLGGPIVYYYWSNHYNHSSYNNLIITGLCGIRPSENDTLDINPLIDKSISYFCLDGVNYHGHELTILYDKNGTRYKYGNGLTIFLDGKRMRPLPQQKKYRIVISAPIIKNPIPNQVNYALNIWRKGYPVPSASINSIPDTSLYQAIDGRIWYFPEITNRWTTEGSTSVNDWYEIDFGKSREISVIKLYLFADNKTFAVPDSVTISYQQANNWLNVKNKTSGRLIGNTVNEISFDKFNATKIRVNFKHTKMQVAVSEIECL
jgi:hypothetical protein